MPKIIKSEVKGIKCDTPGCGWRLDTVLSSSYPAWIDAECPACQGNLLTLADYKAFKTFEKVVGVVNSLFGWMAWLPGRELHETTLHMNGTGVIHVGEPHLVERGGFHD